MRILSLQIKNYRTLENIELTFPDYYSVICGKNDSGKTNVVRVIRKLFAEEDPFIVYTEDRDFSFKDDFTQWKSAVPKKKSISVLFDLLIDRDRDAGLFQFIIEYLKLSQPTDANIHLSIRQIRSADDQKKQITINVLNEEFSGIKAEEVLKKLQSSVAILFHNSTEPKVPYYYSRRSLGSVTDLSEEYKKDIENMKKYVSRGLRKMAKSHQQQIEELLGRLESKYKVSLSVTPYDFENLPYGVNLGDNKVDIVLNEWGSGTQNRTMILLALLRARKMSEAVASASKITPILIIEEPESFLHSSAQAKFGRVIQDLASEFKVQVIVTSHSPYMLSKTNPTSNILLERKVTQGQLRETICMDTSGKNWMEPYGLALGLNRSEFQPFEKLFLSGSECILLVEGEIDKEYFELLRDPIHGDNRLLLTGEIQPYGGRDNLKNTVLVNFIKNRYDHVFVTYDLDADGELSSILDRMGFEKGKNYFAIGSDQPGKRNIEGLVPKSITKDVYSSNPELVSQAMNGSTNEKNSAKQKLKRLILNEFKKRAEPNEDYYKGFYSLVGIINGIIRGSKR